MSLFSTVAEKLQRSSLNPALPACGQSNGVAGAGVRATWSASIIPQNPPTQAPKEQLLEAELERIFASRGFLLGDSNVQSSNRSHIKSSRQPCAALSSSPTAPMEQNQFTTRSTPSTRLGTSLGTSLARTCLDQRQEPAAFETQSIVVADANTGPGAPESFGFKNVPLSISLSLPYKTIDSAQKNHPKKTIKQLSPKNAAFHQTRKTSRSSSDVDGPHTAELVKKRRRLSRNQTTSPLSEPSSTPAGSIRLASHATPVSSGTGPPSGRRQARLSQGAMARRQIFLMGVQRKRAELQRADRKIAGRKGQVVNDVSRVGDSVVMDLEPQSDASLTQESLATAGPESDDFEYRKRQQRRQLVISSTSCWYPKSQSDRTPGKVPAVRDPAAYLAAARAQILLQPSISVTHPAILFGPCWKPISLLRQRQTLAEMHETAREKSQPSSSSPTTPPPFPLGKPPSLVKEEIDLEEEDENDLAFPTSRYESRYFPGDFEDDGVDIYADLARMWPEPGEGLAIDMDAEYEDMGTFGISTFS